jgi:hypothetical protein
MGRIRQTVALALSVLVVGGCASPISQEMVDLRNRFVAAGGLCSEWTPQEKTLALSTLTCGEGATLVVFDSTQDRADFIKSELETNELIRARTHIILSKDTWLVIDTLAVIVRVMPVMGGTISGRNGANP